MNQIKAVEPNSPAGQAGVMVGEMLIQVGEHRIHDVLDYKYYTYDAELTLLLQDTAGHKRTLYLQKELGEDLGLEFETYLMDRARSCANNCVFCFVDQLPPGLRDTLYFKDDDARLSFLMGNYTTLTNLSKREIQRIIDLHISPINISVHATDPELRKILLGNRRAGEGIAIMRRFAAANIRMNCQIVACPGLNDGAALARSLEDLAELYPQVNSISIVPVGVTKWREGLYPLRPFEKEEAAALIAQVEAFGASCKERYGSTIFWCSDEFYLKAELPLPEDDYYEDYTQLENGVGMLRLLDVELRGASLGIDEALAVAPFSIATGVAAAPFLREMIDRAAQKCHTELNYTIYPIKNHFFGETIDVAGLITGGDLIAQLKGKALGERLLIARNMLRHGENVFLDDVTLPQAEEALGVPIVVVGQDGFELFEAVFGV
jgi:putative radical SAM enzyme (TIGR03279 family)